MTRPLTVPAILCVSAAALGLCPVLAASNPVPVTIIAIGDSLVNGYGLPETSQFRTLLERRLKDVGYNVTVVNTGFQEKSKDGAFWIANAFDPVTGLEALSKPNLVAVAILDLGSNDCFGLSLDQTEDYLDQMMAQLAARQIPVLVVGTAAYPDCGAKYVAAFPQVFADLADKYGALLYPEFKTGVLGHPDLLQPDLDHPNAAGEAVVVTSMLPVVEQLIARAKSP